MDIIYDLNSDIDLREISSRKEDISWAFATADLIKRTRSRISFLSDISVKKTAKLINDLKLSIKETLTKYVLYSEFIVLPYKNMYMVNVHIMHLYVFIIV